MYKADFLNCCECTAARPIADPLPEGRRYIGEQRRRQQVPGLSVRLRRTMVSFGVAQDGPLHEKRPSG